MLELPTLTHLRVFILAKLGDDGPVSGRQLQQALQDIGNSPSRQAFYEMMGKLADSGLVAAESRQEDVHGYKVRLTFYSLTEEGRCLCEQFFEYYSHTIGMLDRARPKKRTRRAKVSAGVQNG